MSTRRRISSEWRYKTRPSLAGLIFIWSSLLGAGRPCSFRKAIAIEGTFVRFNRGRRKRVSPVPASFGRFRSVWELLLYANYPIIYSYTVDVLVVANFPLLVSVGIENDSQLLGGQKDPDADLELLELVLVQEPSVALVEFLLISWLILSNIIMQVP